jgi:hypothetical protein
LGFDGRILVTKLVMAEWVGRVCIVIRFFEREEISPHQEDMESCLRIREFYYVIELLFFLRSRAKAGNMMAAIVDI